MVQKVCFDLENAQFLFAASSDNIRLFNIENNKLVDMIQLVNRNISDMKIAEQSQTLNTATLNSNTVSVWYSHLKSLNYDENIDNIPISESSNKLRTSSERKPEPMNIEPPIQPLHQSRS